MAQFDVHINPGRNRSIMPYVVNVQTRRLDDSRTRVVIPLIRLARTSNIEPRLTPEFVVKEEILVLDPLGMFAAPLSALGPVVASLSADADASRIIAAIDAVITQAFG
jgi:toxin CcdB